MKIIDRKTFLQMPAGTLFSKFRPSYFEEFMIKGDTLGANDFAYQRIIDAVACHDSGEFGDILERAASQGTSFAMDFDCQGRDGCFDGDDVKFAVWEQSDVAALINRLNQVACPS